VMFQLQHAMVATIYRRDRIFSRSVSRMLWGVHASASGVSYRDMHHTETSSSSVRWQGHRSFSRTTRGEGVSRNKRRPR
jgi:hypothetical protein